jgi:hypothetical protein
MEIRVTCYSGYKADQRPMKFWLGDDVWTVESIEDQWYGPDGEYFRVWADDGNLYVLSHQKKTDDWILGTETTHEA